MSGDTVVHTVELDVPEHEETQWDRDKRAFWEMRESLLPEYQGKYVAVYNGEVVDSDEDDIALAERVYERLGYVPIYCQLVTDGPLPVYRVPGPRVVRP